MTHFVFTFRSLGQLLSFAYFRSRDFNKTHVRTCLYEAIFVLRLT